MLAPLEASGLLRRPVVPADCGHNAHMYYVLLQPPVDRQSVIAALKEAGIGAVFHYVPLHDAPAGRRYARAHGTLPVTNSLSEQLIRLPLWIGLQDPQLARVAEGLRNALMR
ncbi:MAG TPA: DegT/DnrJ/EryC1/StrS family aminotransferase [Ramlibacter sp.]|nr:DegT/DnrJ/EryC1/StrS family aminotransferase [Ramlibacter sp.]